MKEIIVYADWVGLPSTLKMGILRADLVRGEEIFSFEYDNDWLESGTNQYLDPDLKFYSGPQYISDSKPNFGLFLDSSPDRWGRTLMQRREALLSKKNNKPRKTLFESDFLLGIQDNTRMGALRFKIDEKGIFLNDNSNYSTPPFASIRKLEEASLKIESDDFFEDLDADKWLKMLLAPGSSLGGARPKASVLDAAGHLWIAKFPSKNDDKDSGAWEFVVNKLGSELGINMSTAKAKKYSKKYHSFLTKRFDRNETGQRIHFASAMTLLGYNDGMNHSEGVSYLELVELIEGVGSSPTIDIRELWKRIVFSISVSNTDDHLRNHGFLLSKNGWRLSPAYDINPNETGTGLSLNIDNNDNSLDFELALSVCEYFRWSYKDAIEFLKKTSKTVKTWNDKAKSIGISNLERESMSPAFNIY